MSQGLGFTILSPFSQQSYSYVMMITTLSTGEVIMNSVVANRKLANYLLCGTLLENIRTL